MNPINETNSFFIKRNFGTSHRSQKISHSGLSGQRRTKLTQLAAFVLPFPFVTPNYIEGADLTDDVVFCQNEKVTGKAGGTKGGNGSGSYELGLEAR